MKPLVTVVIPYCQFPELLEDCLSSVYKQTLSPLEIIVADYSTTQPRASIVLTRHNFPALKVLKEESTCTRERAMSLAFRQASGNSLLVLDSDDKLTPLFLELTATHLWCEDGLGAVYSHFASFQDEEMIHEPDYTVSGLLAVPSQLSGLLLKADAYRELGDFEFEFGNYCGSDFLLKLHSSNWKLSKVDEPLYLYRKHLRKSTFAPRLLKQLQAPKAFIERHRSFYLSHHNEVLEKKFNCYQSVYEGPWEVTARLKNTVAMLEEEIAALVAKNGEYLHEYEKLRRHHDEALSCLRITSGSFVKSIATRFLSGTRS